MLTGAELCAYGEQVVTVGQVGGNQQGEFRRVILRDHIVIELHYRFAFGVGQCDACLLYTSRCV